MNDDRLYLGHMLDRIDRIYEFTKGGRETFMSSVLVQDGVIRNLEVIGEAIRQITLELREHYPRVPWRRIAGLRNVLIHEYLGVDLDLVWSVVESDIPALEREIRAILEDLEIR